MRLIAHRGSPRPSATENTVAAVSAALDAGADGVEVDLRLTADGVLALCHDPDLRRVAARPLLVHASSWATLRAAAAEAGVLLARVEWLLAAAGGRPVVLELKASPAPRPRVVDVLVQRLSGLHAAGLPLAVTVSSFDAALVRAVREAVPAHLGVRTALLGRHGCLPTAVLRQALASGHDEVHPHVDDLLEHPSLVTAAARRGVAVVPWTVDAPAAVRRCALLGVDALITDQPERSRLVLQGRQRV